MNRQGGKRKHRRHDDKWWNEEMPTKNNNHKRERERERERESKNDGPQ